MAKKIYDTIGEMIEKYPQLFPRETAWKKIPQSVHDAYWKEYNELFPYKPLLMPDGKEPQGLMEMAKAMEYEREQMAKEPETSWEELVKSINDSIKQEYKIEQQKKALWDKHYKPFKVSYQP